VAGDGPWIRILIKAILLSAFLGKRPLSRNVVTVSNSTSSKIRKKNGLRRKREKEGGCGRT